MMNRPKSQYPCQWILVATALLLAITTAAPAQVAAVLPERFVVARQHERLHIPYDASHPLSGQHEDVQHLLIVIHGLFRNADHYHRVFQGLWRARNDRSIAILAPQFLAEEDIVAHDLDATHPYWARGGWSIGHRSRSSASQPRRIRISSFEVLDEMLRRATDVYPNLQRITIAGHSAGGQFVNRYAAGNRIDDSLQARGIAVRYVVSNPSSYLYFCHDRVTDRETMHFAPVNAEKCAMLNRYRYGMENLNAYMQQSGAVRIPRQYAARRVIYLLGEGDNDPESRYLDCGCGALAQGAHRYERGVIYYAYLAHRFGPEVHERHEFISVPHIGHSAMRMFASEPGRRVLFN